MPTDRVQAIFRLQGCQLRRRWLATKFGVRTRKQLIDASNQQDREILWVAERRANDYRVHQPLMDAVIREMTQGETEQELWRRMLHEQSTRTVRCIRGTVFTVFAKRHGQAMLQPTVQPDLKLPLPELHSWLFSIIRTTSRKELVQRERNWALIRLRSHFLDSKNYGTRGINLVNIKMAR
jgi:hypothetical protein